MDMDLRQLMQTLQSPDGLQQMMLRPAFQDEETGHEFSQAELIADIVNIMRMDSKRIAEAHGMSLKIERMTPERAAELLQGVAKGEDLGLVEIFDAIEDQRMMILEEIEGREAVDDYLEMKKNLLYTHPDEDETNAEPPKETTDEDE